MKEDVERLRELAQIAERRLYPSLKDPNYLVLRSRRMIFERWVGQLRSSPLTVLDIGGRYQPYRSLLKDSVRQYVALDIQQTPIVNVVADGQQLPFKSETFDLVIATQVFEFLARPHDGAKEVLRVLKGGGAFFMSVAAFTPRVVDEELWRFTPAGVRSILANFGKVEIIPEVSSLGGFLRALNLHFSWYATKLQVARRLYGATVCPGLNLLGLALERLKLTANDQFTGNYSVLALKSGVCAPHLPTTS